jgi:ribosomal protein L23
MVQEQCSMLVAKLALFEFKVKNVVLLQILPKYKNFVNENCTGKTFQFKREEMTGQSLQTGV